MNSRDREASKGGSAVILLVVIGAFLGCLVGAAIADAEVKGEVTTNAPGTLLQIRLDGDSPFQVCAAKGYLTAECRNYPRSCECPDSGCPTRVENKANLPTEPATEANCAAYARKVDKSLLSSSDAAAAAAAVKAGLCPVLGGPVPERRPCDLFVLRKTLEFLAAGSNAGRYSTQSLTRRPAPPRDVPGDLEPIN